MYNKGSNSNLSLNLSLKEGLLSYGRFVVELIHLDVVAIVVGNEELEVSIVIEIVGSDRADSAAEILDNLSGEIAMAIGSEKVG
jgi:flagellar motility protein MotE (MotC chaperone)